MATLSTITAVAPAWGAWVEIGRLVCSVLLVIVAPAWGAWVEMLYTKPGVEYNRVARAWGEWVEISKVNSSQTWR